MSEASKPTKSHPDRADWMAAATMGGIATAPLAVGIVGWASHWNAYINLYLTLAGVLFWIVLWVAWRDA